MSVTNYIEETMIEKEILSSINDFKNKNYTVESLYSELKILKNGNQIIRITESVNYTCNECQKKAIYLKPSSDTYLCWLHGYNAVKKS